MDRSSASWAGRSPFSPPSPCFSLFLQTLCPGRLNLGLCQLGFLALWLLFGAGQGKCCSKTEKEESEVRCLSPQLSPCRIPMGCCFPLAQSSAPFQQTVCLRRALSLFSLKPRSQREGRKRDGVLIPFFPAGPYFAGAVFPSGPPLPMGDCLQFRAPDFLAPSGLGGSGGRSAADPVILAIPC